METVAIVTRNDVKFLKVTKSDKRGKFTLEDGSEWNVRTGKRWGNSNKFYFSAPQMVTEYEGRRTEAYRAEQRAKELRHAAYKAGVERITKSLQTYYANDMETVKEKLAEARAELDKLEKEFA